MDEIRQLLQRLAELTTDELAHARELIGTVFNDIEGNTPEAVAQMQELSDALKQVKARATEVATAEAEAERQAEQLRADLAAGLSDEGDEGDGNDEAPVTDPTEDEAGDEPKPVQVDSPDGVPAGQPEAIAASTGPVPMNRGRAAAMNANARPAATGRRSQTVSAPLIASGAVRAGVAPGEAFTGRMDLGKAMADMLNRMPKNGASRGDVIVASAHYEYPDELRLGSDAEENERKIEAATGPQALVASGGVCAPVNVDYGVPTWASADRPLKGGLPSFQTDRGGLTFVPPPDIAALASATAVWTEANDVNPTSPSTKPVLTVSCAAPSTVYVNAIPTRLKFGNMQGRFSPEQVAANTDLAMAAAARIAELELIALMDAASTLVTSAQLLGATRDILATADLVAAAYRYRHRIPDSVMLTVVFPEWAKSLFRADLARELATAGDTALYVSDAQLQQYFTDRNMNPIWTLDGRAAKGSGTTYPAQQFGTQSAGAITAWPNNSTVLQLVWNLFVEGTMQILDGGQLDLGIVRDSTLDATNDYETFIEPFEGLAFRGVEALTVISNLLPNGASAGSIAPSSSNLS